MTAVNNQPVLSGKPKQLLTLAADYGVDKVVKHPWQSFALAIFAGAFIALAFVFYITVTTGSSQTSWGIARLVGGIAFSLGLILVVVLGGELFTSTVLSAVAWARGRVSTRALLLCWGRVYLGNFVGAMLILSLVLMAGLHQLDGGQWGLNALKVAQHKLHHTWLQAFALGVLCNLLVCLGVWMTFACQDALAKSMVLVLPVAMFVSSGFEHSIANLFMVPLGISVHGLLFLGWIEPSGAMTIEAMTAFADLTWFNFIFHNLIPVTLGNIVGGGILVGLGFVCVDIAARDGAAQTDKATCIVYPLDSYRLAKQERTWLQLEREELQDAKDAADGGGREEASFHYVLASQQTKST